VWDTATGSQRAQLTGHQGPVYALALSKDSALAISAGADNTLRLWDVLGGRQLKQFTSSDATSYSIAVSPAGPLVAAGGADRKVRLYDLFSGAVQRTIEGHPDYIHCVTFNPQGNRLLSYGYAGNLMVWNAADGGLLFTQRVGRVGNFAAYAPDGARVLLACGDGTAHILELPAAAK
jgi:WD40 repeat protein